MQATYYRVYDSSENIRKIDYASKLIEDPFEYLNDELSTELGYILNIDPEQFVENNRSIIIHELEHEYVLDPSTDSRHTLGMICNDIAFQIGLAKQCLALIEHYAGTTQHLSSEILDAAMFLVMTTSRGCDPHIGDNDVVLMFVHCTFCYQTMYCLPDEERRLGERVGRIFDGKTRSEHEFEYELLRSYTVLDDRSIRHFSRALELNDVALLHATLLAKRLSYQGFDKAAIGVLENASERLQQLNLEAVRIDKEDYLGPETCNSTFRLKQEYRDLTDYFVEIEKMSAVLAEGKYYAFYETGRCSLRWDN